MVPKRFPLRGIHLCTPQTIMLCPGCASMRSTFMVQRCGMVNVFVLPLVSSSAAKLFTASRIFRTLHWACCDRLATSAMNSFFVSGPHPRFGACASNAVTTASLRAAEPHIHCCCAHGGHTHKTPSCVGFTIASAGAAAAPEATSAAPAAPEAADDAGAAPAAPDGPSRKSGIGGIIRHLATPSPRVLVNKL